MKKLPLPLVLFLIGAIFALIPYSFLSLFQKSPDLTQAYEHYLTGEKADGSVAIRQKAFNQALKLYIDLENQYDPIYGNGKLYYNIANTYFQLNQYPLAIFYYYQAGKLMPRNTDLQLNLKTTLNKLNLSVPSSDSIFKKIFFFHYLLSLPERLQLFFICGGIFLVLASLNIWWKKTWLKTTMAISGLFCGIFFLSACYTKYLESIEGIIITSSLLYRDAGFQYAKASEEPLLAGSKVEILDLLLNGTWIKILTPQGTLAYLPANSIRLIRT